MRGRVHNAKISTIDGSDYWIAALLSDDGKFSCLGRDVSDGYATAAEAVKWAKTELRRRGFAGGKVEVAIEKARGE